MTEISKVLTRALGLSKQASGESNPGFYDIPISREPDPDPVYPADTMDMVEVTDGRGNPARFDNQPVSENEYLKKPDSQAGSVYQEVPYEELDNKHQRVVREENERYRQYRQDQITREATRRTNEQERSGTVPHQVAEYVRDDQGNVVGHQDMRGHYVSYTRTPEQYQEAFNRNRRESEDARARQARNIRHDLAHDRMKQKVSQKGAIESRKNDKGELEWSFEDTKGNPVTVSFDGDGNFAEAEVQYNTGETRQLTDEHMPELRKQINAAIRRDPPDIDLAELDFQDYTNLPERRKNNLIESARKRFTEGEPIDFNNSVEVAAALDASPIHLTSEGYRIPIEGDDDLIISQNELADIGNMDAEKYDKMQEYLEGHYEGRREKAEGAEQALRSPGVLNRLVPAFINSLTGGGESGASAGS